MKKVDKSDHAGGLPAWSIDTLPAPPPFTFRNLLRIIGPGAILLASSIGGGEWLIAPAAAVKYGAAILSITTLAIACQVLFNLQAIRYTLYTGESIYVGIMRLRPGAAFWAVTYCAIAFVQMSWPALAASAATTLFSSWQGRLPDAADSTELYWLGVLLVLATVVILLFGGTVERMLERISWLMVAFIFAFLLIVNILFVSWEQWVRTAVGFFSLPSFDEGLDWALIGALAASAGAGGGGNLSITQWIRDKGFGMGAKVGAIPSAFGSYNATVSHLGKIFQVSAESLQHWKQWLRYVHADQVWLWCTGALAGMFLNANLALSIVPSGTDLSGLAAGAYQAEYMARSLWTGFWVLALLNGFWILYSSHLNSVDVLTRTITDILWTASARIRAWRGGRIKLLYYGFLLFYSLFAMLALRAAPPLVLFKIMANVGGFLLAFSGTQILLVNRRFLPRELRAPLWQEAGLVACVLFYGFFVCRLLISFVS